MEWLGGQMLQQILFGSVQWSNILNFGMNSYRDISYDDRIDYTEREANFSVA